MNPTSFFSRLSFRTANGQFGMILLVGVGLGLANYALGVYDALGRSIVLQVVISVLIGYSLIVLTERITKGSDFRLVGKNGLIAALLCFLIGIVATEGQLFADYLLFNKADYRPGQAGGIYVFNGILSVILGLLTIRWYNTVQTPEPKAVPALSEKELTKVPLRKGEKTVLIDISDVLYFEAYDNYAFLHHADGSKNICSFSLATLENRLDQRFLRVHRKYLINKEQIVSLTPHLKQRYLIAFTGSPPKTIRSSTSYAEVVKKMMKL